MMVPSNGYYSTVLFITYLGIHSAKAQATSSRTCLPNDDPTTNSGTCILRNHITRKCSGDLQYAFSSDCYGRELCCFDPNILPTALPTIPLTSPRPTTPATTTPIPVRYCIPDSGPQVPNGICRGKVDIASFCFGLALSTSQNCLMDEVCCYVAPPTTTPKVTLPTTTTTTTTTTVAPVRNCSPGSYSAITNGICTAADRIAQLCKGKQISPSLDCGTGEYCCFFADTAVGAGFYQVGLSCSPDNDVSIGRGTCVDAQASVDQCGEMLFSRSRQCERSQVCCYPSRG